VTSIARGWREISAETAEFSQRTIAANTGVFERLLGARSLDSAVQIQTDFARSMYEAFVDETSKIGGIYARFAKQAVQPLEKASAAVQATRTAP
jgi:hypothetical protein